MQMDPEEFRRRFTNAGMQMDPEEFRSELQKLLAGLPTRSFASNGYVKELFAPLFRTFPKNISCAANKSASRLQFILTEGNRIDKWSNGFGVLWFQEKITKEDLKCKSFFPLPTMSPLVIISSTAEGYAPTYFIADEDSDLITSMSVYGTQFVRKEEIFGASPSKDEVMSQVFADEEIQAELRLLYRHFCKEDVSEILDDWECRLANRMYFLMGSPFVEWAEEEIP